MTHELGPEVRVLPPSWPRRLVGVGIGAALLLAGGGVAALGQVSHWPRLAVLGGVLGIAGLLVAAITARQLGDRVTLHAEGLVRRSKVLGDKAVRFDAITAIRGRPPPPSKPGGLEIEAGDTFVTVDNAVVADLDGLIQTLRERTGHEIGGSGLVPPGSPGVPLRP